MSRLRDFHPQTTPLLFDSQPDVAQRREPNYIFKSVVRATSLDYIGNQNLNWSVYWLLGSVSLDWLTMVLTLPKCKGFLRVPMRLREFRERLLRLKSMSTLSAGLWTTSRICSCSTGCCCNYCCYCIYCCYCCCSNCTWPMRIWSSCSNCYFHCSSLRSISV